MTDPISNSSIFQVASLSAAAAPGQSAVPAPLPPQAVQSMGQDRTCLQDVATTLNQHVQQLQTSLHFQIDQVTGQLVMSVLDSETQKVLLQVPGAQALAIAQSLQHLLHPQLMNETA